MITKIKYSLDVDKKILKTKYGDFSSIQALKAFERGINFQNSQMETGDSNSPDEANQLHESSSDKVPEDTAPRKSSGANAHSSPRENTAIFEHPSSSSRVDNLGQGDTQSQGSVKVTPRGKTKPEDGDAGEVGSGGNRENVGENPTLGTQGRSQDERAKISGYKVSGNSITKDGTSKDVIDYALQSKSNKRDMGNPAGDDDFCLKDKGFFYKEKPDAGLHFYFKDVQKSILKLKERNHIDFIIHNEDGSIEFDSENYNKEVIDKIFGDLK